MAAEPIVLRCNGCAGVFEAHNQAVASTCYHLFCTECAQKLIEGGEVCPICGAGMSKSTVKLVTLLQPSSKCRLVLCGQTPQVITDTALTAINFYVEQQRLGSAYTNHKLQQRTDAIQAQCRQKLTQMQTAYQQARQKCQQILQQKNAIEQDNQELQQKYAQKAVQARKLQEMFKALQQENEELKRRLGVRGGVGAAAGASGGRGGMLGSGGGSGGSGRHPSPFGGGGGPAQMVTTVRQTKSVIELSPPPGSLHLLTGHGSAVVGSGAGGQRPITPGGYGAGAAGFFGGSSPNLGPSHRPGTSGGMFAAGAGMGGARGGQGGGGMGGGGGMRLSRGMGGLGSPGQGMMSL